MHKHHSRFGRGFTLIELMITVMIAGILLGIGIPNMTQFIRNNRLTSAANDLLVAIHVARTEAIKRRVPTRVCFSPAPDAPTPTCGGNGMQGWVSWVDTNNDGVPDGEPTEPILVRHGALPTSLTFISRPNGNAGYVAFRPTGFSLAAADDVSGVVLCDVRGNQALYGVANSTARGLVISNTGRPRVTRSVSEINGIDLLNGASCP